MATSKKRSRKPAKRVVRRVPIGRCTDVGNELKTLGTSAAAVKARAHGGVCLRKQSKDWRPVKTKSFIVPPRAAARRARLARAAKRGGVSRRSAKNGMDAPVSSLTADERHALDAFKREHGARWKSVLLRMRANSGRFPMDYPGAYRAFQKVGPKGIRAYGTRKAAKNGRGGHGYGRNEHGEEILSQGQCCDLIDDTGKHRTWRCRGDDTISEERLRGGRWETTVDHGRSR